jgi:2-octaprenyl-6-methoxyphenol hydroxylase
VWTVRTAQAEPLLALDDAEFLQALQPAFGYRAGRFLRVGARSAYPLALRFVRKAVHGRVAFIGNAAHTLHPVAGQGFNLGLRDVAALAKTLAAALAQDLDIGSADVLKTYARWRRPDYLRTALFTDGLIRSFSNNQPPLRLARNLGLLALNALPFARRSLARQAMGLGRSQQHGL